MSRVRITSELPPGATVRDDGTIDWSDVKRDEPTWIRHELPNGKRSLWLLSFVGWVTLTDAKHNMTRADVGKGWFYMDDGAEMVRGLADYQCPTPTPEDLAWLRGAA